MTIALTLFAAIWVSHVQLEVGNAASASLSVVREHLERAGIGDVPRLRSSCKISSLSHSLYVCIVEEDPITSKSAHAFEIKGSSHPLRFKVGVLGGNGYRLYGFGEHNEFNELVAVLGRTIESCRDAVSQVNYFFELVWGPRAPFPLNPDGTLSSKLIYEEVKPGLTPGVRSTLKDLADRNRIVAFSVEKSESGDFIVSFDGVYEELRKGKLCHFVLSVQRSGEVAIVSVNKILEF